jgi:two-component system, NarL family, response regulator NreC
MKFTVMLVDDHAIVLHGLTLLINESADLEVSYQARSAEEALETLRSNPLPDMIVTDISLPGLSGIDFTRSVKSLYPKLPVLVLSMHDEIVHGERAFRAGARGYLTKQEATDKVALAIRCILSGADYMGPKLRTALGKQPGESASSGMVSVLGSLTDREFEIFRLIGMGMTSSEIAIKLSRSVKTIEAHRANLKQKLSLRNAVELNHFAANYADRERV